MRVKFARTLLFLAWRCAVTRSASPRFQPLIRISSHQQIREMQSARGGPPLHHSARAWSTETDPSMQFLHASRKLKSSIVPVIYFKRFIRAPTLTRAHPGVRLSFNESFEESKKRAFDFLEEDH